jgi:hypothetical protein
MIRKKRNHFLLWLLVPALPFLLLFLIFVGIIGGLSNGGETGTPLEQTSENANLSPEVLQYKPLVEKYAKEAGISDQVPVLLAIMMVESGGRGTDVFQSSESLGLPVNTLGTEASIKQGVTHYKNCLDAAKQLKNDQWTAVASYNFGGNYNNYIAQHGHKHTTKLADTYSRTVVAPSLGNTTGLTYPYLNPVAIPYNGGYLYLNGGNFFYPDLVKQYLVQSVSGKNSSTSATGWKKKAVENAQKDVGQAFPTGWGQRGECIVAVQGWINSAKPGTFIPGGVRTGYVQSGATEVPWNQAKAGDVIQYENTSSPDLFATGVHTMLVESTNTDGTINIIESNNPDGSGLVGKRNNLTSTAPAGWRSVVWHFPD